MSILNFKKKKSSKEEINSVLEAIVDPHVAEQTVQGFPDIFPDTDINTNQSSTMNTSNTSIYHNIKTLPRFHNFLFLDFLTTFVSPLILISLFGVFIFIIPLDSLHEYLSTALYTFFFIIAVCAILYFYKLHNFFVEEKVKNKLIIDFSKLPENEHVKLSTHEYLIFLLEISDNHNSVKQVIRKQINETSDVTYKVESFLKNNLHLTLKDTFLEFQNSTLTYLKDTIFNSLMETYEKNKVKRDKDKANEQFNEQEKVNDKDNNPE